MPRAKCMACQVVFDLGTIHLCDPCSTEFFGENQSDLSFADKLMTAMRPLTRQVDNLLKNNELLGEILATLSMPRNQGVIHEALADLVKDWNNRKRKIKED